MKKLMLLIAASFVLVGCGSSVVSDGKFTFNEEEFKDVYEEVNDINTPTNITTYDVMINIEYANKEEVLRFLKAANEITGYKEIERLRKSIELDEGNIKNVITNDDISIVYDDRYEDEYGITIYPDGKKFDSKE